MPTVTPIDPLTGPKLALSGRIVTVDERFTVLQHGVVFIERGSIVAVQDAAAPPASGFETTPVIPVGGTIYPGLIELHNHLSYDALQLWKVPKKFTNRSQWGKGTAYKRLVSGPMSVLGRSAALLPAVIRFVECKCLLGGVTTSQGIELYSNRGARRYYRGLVRNVEQTDDAALPEAAAKVTDIEAKDAHRFLARLSRQSCFLLHLSEGVDQAARDHFLALQVQPGQWAITPALSGIHCVALNSADFDIMGQHGGSMVWSPLSNLLLYGATAKVKEARASGVKMGIGSDWSPSGSKNLLGELKVAHLFSQNTGGIFTERDLVAMATRDAASMLKWEKALGTIEKGKRADLLVIDGVNADPYSALLRANEASIRLVMINGVPRFGDARLMQDLGSAGETVQVGPASRVLNLKQRTADPVVGAITLAQARHLLADALERLPQLALEIERQGAPPEGIGVGRMAARPRRLQWFLALDELIDTGMELRPRLPLPGQRTVTGPSVRAARAAVPLSRILQPLKLDQLTVVDDSDFLDRIEAQKNLPAFLGAGLRELY